MATEKTEKKTVQLYVKMSKENLYKLKEKALKERLTIRQYVHHALGLILEAKEKKK